MSDNNDDNLDPNDGENGGTGPKALRDQLAKVNKTLETLQKENDELKAKQRSTDLATFLAEHKAPAKLAKYAARDIEGDVTTESVKKWLEDEGELFGWKPADGDDEDEDLDDDEQEARLAARRISTASSNAPDSRNGVTVAKLREASLQTLIEQGIISGD